MEKYISPYILRTEYACHHCGALPPAIVNAAVIPYIYELFFGRFEVIRQQWGGPLNISSGYRCPEYQMDLFIRRKSQTPYSVHIFGLALDIDVVGEDDVDKLVDIIEGVDPDMRIGSDKYLANDQTFVHMDVGYLISPIYDAKLHEGVRW